MDPASATYRLPEWLQAYVGFEDDAVAVRTFSLELIPGLLQTEPYARVIYSIRPLPSGEVDRRVAARLQRQCRLTAPDPPTLSAVLSEATLVRTLAFGEIGVQQLHHVAVSAKLANVSVRILPFSAGAHASMSGSFTLLGFAPDVSPPIAYQEYAVGGHLVDDEDDVQKMSALHDQLRDQALGCDESLTMISELTQRAR